MMMRWWGGVSEASLTQVVVGATVTLVTFPSDGTCRAIVTCDVQMMCLQLPFAEVYLTQVLQ